MTLVRLKPTAFSLESSTLLLSHCTPNEFVNRSWSDQILYLVNVLKLQTPFFLFSNKMSLIRAGIHKMLVRIANNEDPDQTASEEAV